MLGAMLIFFNLTYINYLLFSTTPFLFKKNVHQIIN